ncbi:MAG: hypothetical protein M1816_008081 [Peltula sp. TS41687]|nr:MAG: hypothetical protein M1816_008081 [Peltula sp. TS41687]
MNGYNDPTISLPPPLESTVPTATNPAAAAAAAAPSAALGPATVFPPPGPPPPPPLSASSSTTSSHRSTPVHYQPHPPGHPHHPYPPPHPHAYPSHLTPSSGPSILIRSAINPAAAASSSSSSSSSPSSFIPPSSSHPYHFAPQLVGFAGHPQQTPLPPQHQQIPPSHPHYPYQQQRLYGGTGTGNQLGPYGQQPFTSQAESHLPLPLPPTHHPHQTPPSQTQYPYGPITMAFPVPNPTISTVSGAMMHPAMQGQMAVHQSPYTTAGAPYARTVNPSPSRPPSSFSASKSPLTQPIYTPPEPRSIFTPIQSPSQQTSPQPPQQQVLPQYQSSLSSQQHSSQQQQDQMSIPTFTSLPPTSQPSQSVLPPTNLQQGMQRVSFSQPPLSPSSREREKERISLLLQINGELLKELVRLQTEGKGAGLPSQSPSSQGPSPMEESVHKEDKDGLPDGQISSPPKPVTPHPTYIECMRCLQANLAYLAAVADRAHKPSSSIPSSPAIITAPKSMSSSFISELYRNLAELFPESSRSAVARG